MCTQYLHYIQPPCPFLTPLPPTGTTFTRQDLFHSPVL
jgi:hypothetical protein